MRRRSSQLPGSDLYGANRPSAWLIALSAVCASMSISPMVMSVTATDWAAAVRAAAIHLPDAVRGAGDDIDALLALTLGEGQFGPHHWRIGSAQRLYYFLKPALPRWATRRLRRLHRRSLEPAAKLHWPAETRYAAFVFEVARQIRQRTNRRSLPFIHFWPHGYRYAFVLTHDVETADGQRRVFLEAIELARSLGGPERIDLEQERHVRH